MLDQEMINIIMVNKYNFTGRVGDCEWLPSNFYELQNLYYDNLGQEIIWSQLLRKKQPILIALWYYNDID